MEASVLSFSLECIPFSFQLSHGHFLRLIDGCDHFNNRFFVFRLGFCYGRCRGNGSCPSDLSHVDIKVVIFVFLTLFVTFLVGFACYFDFVFVFVACTQDMHIVTSLLSHCKI